jgi:thiamine-monophosphate kinase
VNPSEFEIIDRFFTRRLTAPARGVSLGIGDDAAILRVPQGCELVAAVDTIVEGRHFLTSTSPRSIAHRALAVNLSDFAAMGATPAWALLALTLPDAEEQWLSARASGRGGRRARQR